MITIQNIKQSLMQPRNLSQKSKPWQKNQGNDGNGEGNRHDGLQ
jgi:hypothetical protein